MEPEDMNPFVRARSKDDLPACERLARAVHLSDGYPVFLPDGDFRRFVASPGELAAWIAEQDGEIVGHVALHPMTSLRAIGLVRSKLGLEPSRLGVIARLTVASSARGRGVGRLLLEAATAETRQRGLVPILDVVPRHESAVSLFERAGWTQIGKVNFDLPDGSTVAEFVYCAPAATI
jgi:GNAT superfamily N-acetyltransferase